MKKILQGRSGRESFYLAKQTDGWVGFTQFLSATPIEVHSIEDGLTLCNPDETSGLKFTLIDVHTIGTIKLMGLYTSPY